jgi:hypothetical protein
MLSYIKAKTGKVMPSQSITEESSTSRNEVSDPKPSMVKIRVVGLQRTTTPSDKKPAMFEECISVSKDAPLSMVWGKLIGLVAG